MENNFKKDVCALLVPDNSEDSVDIYDGLDGSISGTAAKSPLWGCQLKESMDLYEELVTEEEQSKEASYSELKSRFQAAQNQIQELRRRLEQMEMKNTGLTSENCCLKKNISVLLQTARLEVKRKDAEILRLNQQSNKACYRPQLPRSNPRDPNQPKASSEANSLSRPPLPAPPPPSCPPPPAPPLPALPRRPDHPLRDQPQPGRRESTELTRASKPSSHSTLKRDHEVADTQTLSDKHRSKCSEEKYQSEKLSESTDKRHRKLLNPSNDYHVSELNRSHRADGRQHDPKLPKSKCSNEEHGAKTSLLESLHKSDKKDGSGERRPDKTATLAPDQASQRRSNESHNQEREERRNRTSDKHRSSDTKEHKKSSHNAQRHRESSKEREANRHKSHQRKEDRRHDQKSDRKHSRSSQSEASKEREKGRPKELSGGKVDVCGKEKQGKHHKETRISSEKPPVAEKTNVDENSPNRKLSFMETLNLTLSPIKKPGLPVDGCQEDLMPVEEDTRRTSDEDTSQPDFEDMCVIDEVDNSECEAGLSEVVNKSVDHPEASCSEKTSERFDRKDAEEEKKSDRIHSKSEQSQPLNTAQSQATVGQRLSSPESTSSRAVDDRGSHQDTINLVTDSKPEAKDDTNPIKTSESISKQHVNDDLQRTDLHIISDSSAALREPVVLDPSLELPKFEAPQSTILDSPLELSVTSPPTETKTVEEEINRSSPEVLGSPPAVPPQVSQPEPGPGPQKDGGGGPEHSKDTDAVTSTISLESLPQEGLSLTEAIYVLTQTEEDTSAEPSSSTGCIGVSAVSSTTEEKAPSDCYSNLTATPKKTSSPGRKWQSNMEPSSSVPVIYDEDSMMRTLSNLKRIPDAISPLRSPVQISKRHLSHVHGKPGHVKSLQKDFSSGTIDASSTKLDVNKENKYPGSPANRDAQNLVEKVSDVSSGPSDSDLEEGEILSESDEAAGSPNPPAKRPKLTKPVRNKPSTNCVLKRKLDERGVASKEPHEMASASTRSPKGRFKTVCPAATKASFSTTEEVMETFKVVRSGIRRKYMKLHKSFPKKSFYGVMENFQESFLEFVDGAHFGQISSQAGELKSKLKKLITSVFGKVSNNGIVKRIFEQQAVDMKQKLWDFVDAQVNYLFREIEMTLKSTCKTSQVEGRRTSRDEKVSSQSPTKKPQCKQKEALSEPFSLNRTRLCAYKTGLGSRGKDIRITHGEIERGVNQHPPNGQSTRSVVDILPPKNIFLTPEKNNTPSLVVSQNGQLVDKTDFQLLTEQQASSLTFNLVRDSQMGEIFKCLLQGSDLLEGGGDNSAWTLGTPRKDGERFISVSTPSKFESPSKLLSPTKFDTPSKLVATWANISPRKVSSPCLKDPLNPALFDENCLLEVPSENPIPSQKTFSILAEDLAVSLTIPSPLKSDSHLSFLQPSSAGMHIMSTPDSVISAHISEDTLMDGEDATEQDIHLALDTDNSSCNPSSSSSGGSSPLAMPFVFKPDVPMQALVMEKSNDHFILKIRQANTSGSVTLTDEDSCDRNLSEEMQQKVQGDVAHGSPSNRCLVGKLHNCADASRALPSDQDLSHQAVHSGLSPADTRTMSCLTHNLKLPQINNLSHINDMFQQNTSKEGFSNQSAANLHKANLLYNSLNKTSGNSAGCTINAEDSLTVPRKEKTPRKSGSETLTHERPSSPSQAAETDTPLHLPPENSHADQQSQALPSQVSAPEKNDAGVSKPESGSTVAGDTSSSPKNTEKDRSKRKRKKHQKKSKTKRSKEGDRETPMVMAPGVRRDEEESRSSQMSLSPTSLSAKNVIRKKGEVVVAWTREEDRAILVALKTKGASRDTFSILSEKLQKPSEQVAHRFHQLMKLFKKMDP